MTKAPTIFHPLIRRWFAERIGAPTPVQQEAWPVIAEGWHALISAPTGSGKTLTAFLWGLNQLINGAWPAGRISLLYISPLKALNNDIRRNLLTPLDELTDLFERAGETFPDIYVMTRSGDTEASDRRRMLRHPPAILITTPESLNILLSSRKARPLLAHLKTVILDEIHAVAGTKRGVHLLSAVERLTRLSGEFQRLALSATVRPLQRVADLVGGYQLDVQAEPPRYRRREVRIVAPPQAKEYRVRVCFPEPAAGPQLRRKLRTPFLSLVADFCKQIIQANRSTLVFVNNRRHCERLCLLINQDEPEIIAYSHHGSLSREMRAVVEKRLKRGELRAIVATSSLELGIDIGPLDQVILVETPVTISSAVQRIGRAGHQVGAASEGTLVPLNGRDVVYAAVMARTVMDHDIEPIRPVTCPLDVLAQVIVSMAGMESWRLDALFDFLRTISAFHPLSRTHFDLVVAMLAGRYQEARLRVLKPLVSVDGLDGTIEARESSVRLLYSSGGTIPDRGYFHLRHAETRAKVGDLDEEFVWERRVGDTFALGMQSWRILEITHNDVLAAPVSPTRSDVPFWRAENLDRGFHFSSRIGGFLEWANDSLDDPVFCELLREEYGLTESAVAALLGFLKRQRAAVQGDLPHRHHLVLERFLDPDQKEAKIHLVLHTLWGGCINRPLSFVLAQAWEDAYGGQVDVFSNNDCIVLLVPDRLGIPEEPDLFALVPPERIETLLRHRLEQTGFFGARFRENAARALLLPRHTFARRMPLWVNRQRSRQLLEAIAQYEDFPILLETWRTCLQDDFDLEGLQEVLAEVQSGEIRTSIVTTTNPSPFCDSILWRVTNALLYGDDTPAQKGPSRLREDLLQEAVHLPRLRPKIARALVETFEQKAQRTFPGYAPRTPRDVIDWIKERLLMPAPEWDALRSAIEQDDPAVSKKLTAALLDKVVMLTFPDRAPGITAVESLPRLARVFGQGLSGAECRSLLGRRMEWPEAALAQEAPNGEENGGLAEWLREWFRFYGPRELTFYREVLPLPEERLLEAIEELVEERVLVVDRLTDPGDREEVCDSENLEILLRQKRSRARSDLKPLPADWLPLFIAAHQGLASFAPDMQGALQPLLGHPVPASLLETEVLPARIPDYRPSMLDVVARESELIWVGSPGKKVVLAFPEGRDLFSEPQARDDPSEQMWREIAPRLFADPRGRYTFESLLESTGLTTEELNSSLWEFTWEGRVANDAFSALRKGLEMSFKVDDEEARGPRRRRAWARRWSTARTVAGNWHMLPPVEEPGDLVDREELNRDRVRLLLDRYGILFRELLARELPPLRWGSVFRTLRLMELAGEVVAGCFFEGIPGIQFASHAAVRMFREGIPEEAVFWVNAADPGSLCGLDIEAMKGALPRRVAGNHLTYHGRRLVVVSQRHGKELDIRVPPDHPLLEKYLEFISVQLTRAILPKQRVDVETINGEPSGRSPYLTWFRDFLDVCVDSKKTSLWKLSS